MTPEEILDKRARYAANTWCRCFKCDGQFRNFEDVPFSTCNKDKMVTCREWYDCYRVARIALHSDDFANITIDYLR